MIEDSNSGSGLYDHMTCVPGPMWAGLATLFLTPSAVTGHRRKVYYLLTELMNPWTFFFPIWDNCGIASVLTNLKSI